MTPACADDHVSVLLEDDVGVIVEVEDGQSGELRRRTAGLRYGRGIHHVGHGLDDRVVRGVMGVQEGDAVAIAVVGGVALRSYDPVLQFDRSTVNSLRVS